jgi:hypothetical protein
VKLKTDNYSGNEAGKGRVETKERAGSTIRLGE